MKTSLTLSLAAAALFALGMNLHSQAPVAVAPVAPVAAAPAVSKVALQSLQTMKAKNQELLEKQAQTLILLDTLEKEAEQLKIFAKRS